MYFPLLRGKQYESIALRELSEVLSTHSDKVSPIIEPVKDSFTTLRITLESLKESNVNFNLIVNPMVGELVGGYASILRLAKETLDHYSNFQISFYVNNQRTIDESERTARRIDFEFNGFSLVHTSQLDNVDEIDKLSKHAEVRYNIVDLFRTSRRYPQSFSQETRVSLEDHFNLLSRNSDYANNVDEAFSEEHLYYRADKYAGFADYLTIGQAFSEAGFLPYAVAIHLTYADAKKKIRIHHFVSDSNDDTTDVAGKFAEALDKLVSWVNGRGITSPAVEEFKQLHRNGHFPGLGSVKKLSIEHHIELVLGLI